MIRRLLVLAAVLVLTACASQGPDRGTPREEAELARAIAALSPSVDSAEARDAARLAYLYTFQLARAYQITDPPLIHNAKVNAGTKPRGLCRHWAEDMERLLNDAGFETLEVHRAIANADNALRIEHSTAVISARGAPMQSGIVIDPWRRGGSLFWSRVGDDSRYAWHLREDVLRARGQVRYRR